MISALSRRAGLFVALSIVVGGCVSSRPVPPPPASVGGERPGERELVVSLLWSPDVDLDLYVTDPTLETVYFANPRAASGGRLARDATCHGGESGPGPADSPMRETVLFIDPPKGRYRVGIDYIDHCGSEEGVVGYRLVVESKGLRRETTGSVRLARFVYRALEFELPGVDSGNAP